MRLAPRYRGEELILEREQRVDVRLVTWGRLRGIPTSPRFLSGPPP
jgi:hypothetical protein